MYDDFFNYMNPYEPVYGAMNPGYPGFAGDPVNVGLLDAVAPYDINADPNSTPTDRRLQAGTQASPMVGAAGHMQNFLRLAGMTSESPLFQQPAPPQSHAAGSTNRMRTPGFGPGHQVRLQPFGLDMARFERDKFGGSYL